VFLAGGAGALYFSSSAFWTLSADLGGASAGSVSGVMNMGNQISGMITASLTPLIADHYGWTSSFVFAALICFGGGIVWLFIDPEQSLS
jgi:ACS family glucarate transporter-like MFS transporter